MEDLRCEIVAELTECLRDIKKTNFLFLPKFEKAIAKVELFQEKAKSPTIDQLMLMLRCHMENSYPEISVNKIWVSNLKQLLHFIENIVLQSPEN